MTTAPKSAFSFETLGWDAAAFASYIVANPPQHLLNNEWYSATDEGGIPFTNASTGRVLASQPDGSATTVDIGVGAARAAHPAWAGKTVAARAEYIRQLGELLDRYGMALALADSVCAGMPTSAATGDVAKAAAMCIQWAEMAPALAPVRYDVHPGEHRGHYSSFGVVARITAFNHPVLFAVRGMVPALLAGNTVIIKPAHQVPGSIRMLSELIARVFPPGVVNIIYGGAATGSALCGHDDVPRIAFTGSVPVGLAILSTASSTQLKQVTLELGGKNALVVNEDVPIDFAAEQIIAGMNLTTNTGQSCGSTTRVYVHESIIDDVYARVCELADTLRIGAAYIDKTDIGPLIDGRSVDRVAGYVRRAADAGAQIRWLGQLTADASTRGYFSRVAVVRGADHDWPINQEEIFGPVFTMQPWSERESLLAAINSTDYGLTAGVLSADTDWARDMAAQIEAGYIWINGVGRHYFGTPFGGWKNSGLGKEESLDEFYSYLRLKAVHVGVLPRSSQ